MTPVPGPGIAFAEAQRVLALFVEGLLGRPLRLRPADATGADARTRRIATDGESLVVPARVDWFAARADNATAYRMIALHQVGYLQFGTFGFDLGVARTRMPLAAAMQGRLDLRSLPARLDPALRQAPLERFFNAGERPALLRRLFATLEDWRIDTALARRYPGAHRRLALLHAHALAGRRPLAALGPGAALVEALVQASLGASSSVLVAARPALPIAALLDIADVVRIEDASVYDSARAALAIEALVIATGRRAHGRRGAPPGPDTDEDPVDPGGDMPSLPVEAGGGEDTDEVEAGDDEIDGAGVAFRGELMPALVHQTLKAGLAGQLAEAAAAGELSTEESGDGAAAVESTTLAHRRGRSRHQTAGMRSHLHDEWDCHRGAYLPAWCRVNEQRLEGNDTLFIADARRRHAALFEAVRRSFRAIRPLSWQRVHRMPDGPEVELDGVIEAVIDRRAGHATDERLYLRRERGQRDVAAAFLVDMSASTDFPIPVPGAPKAAGESQPTEPGVYLWAGHDAAAAPPPPPGRRVIDVERDALALMGDALCALGDAHAIYGFSGSGRDNVEFAVAKDFADRTSARTWSAVAAMAPRGATRMGAAIRHALLKLRHVPAATRVLIVVSDGYPEDRDYGPDPRDDAYGIADTAQALKEAERAGVTAYCVTIDPAGHDYLRRMCAPGRYRVIGEIEALPGALADLYRELTT